ncbi:Rho-GDP dissociation inhibitor [Niveomyces insectorum RCEF 264]|uniref:Rho-GDP dissociation inhibitor n=1 Tax=Niveomyces insectorum RCEF 264 TaxID=1081102 RepID=A0A167PVV5_9HYPO|nr:Rho-GDP dissociation inhibitor [Niveomyces insectorum RCEF 264]
MASEQHDDDIHEGTPGYKLSQPKQSLATYQQMEAGAEAEAEGAGRILPEVLLPKQHNGHGPGEGNINNSKQQQQHQLAALSPIL